MTLHERDEPDVQAVDAEEELDVRAGAVGRGVGEAQEREAGGARCRTSSSPLMPGSPGTNSGLNFWVP